MRVGLDYGPVASGMQQARGPTLGMRTPGGKPRNRLRGRSPSKRTERGLCCSLNSLFQFGAAAQPPPFMLSYEIRPLQRIVLSRCSLNQLPHAHSRASFRPRLRLAPSQSTSLTTPAASFTTSRKGLNITLPSSGSVPYVLPPTTHTPSSPSGIASPPLSPRLRRQSLPLLTDPGPF